MMMRGWLAAGFGSLALFCSLPVVAQQTTTSAATTISAAFQKPVLLTGTIGDEKVQVSLRPKVPADEGIEGNYFFFGQSLNILLAGEIEGEVFLLEESRDGTHISGQWDGNIAGDSVTGTWMSADGSVTKPFALQIMQPAASKPTARK